MRVDIQRRSFTRQVDDVHVEAVDGAERVDVEVHPRGVEARVETIGKYTTRDGSKPASSSFSFDVFLTSLQTRTTLKRWVKTNSARTNPRPWCPSPTPGRQSLVISIRHALTCSGMKPPPSLVCFTSLSPTHTHQSASRANTPRSRSAFKRQKTVKKKLSHKNNTCTWYVYLRSTKSS